MSHSSYSSSQSSEYKNFRHVTRDRLLYEMLRPTMEKDKSTRKVLILDRLTVKIMSHSCKMADIKEEGVLAVENLYKQRPSLPLVDGIYFIQPTKESVNLFLSDMSGKAPLYGKAYVFFSSPIRKVLVSIIKRDTNVLSRLGALREMNLEYFAIDNQGFITGHERALEELFGEDAEGSQSYNEYLSSMANRIATVFASLKEFPFVRYRAAKSSLDFTTTTTLCDLVPTKLAAEVWNCLDRYKGEIPGFPQNETCELFIVDRSIDQIAPIIHEWSYDAMCHDLLTMDGNKYIHEVPTSFPSKTGSTEKKVVLLEDHDPIWLELRHAHIAEVSERLHDKMQNFVSKNKAAQIYLNARDGGELSTSDLKKIAEALPQYSEQIKKLSLHIEIAGKINRIIREQGLKDVGQLEQDLVFGDAGTEELIDFLQTKQDVSQESKLRLMMIYASIYPRKFEDGGTSKLMQLAQLSTADMIAVNNMRCLGGSDNKNASGTSFSLKFDMHEKRHGFRKERKSEEETWQLSRFYPLIEELTDKLSKGELPKDEYPCMNPASPLTYSYAQNSPVYSNHGSDGQAHSMRSRRPATWARPRNSNDGYSSDSVLRHASSNFRKLGRRIFIFIVGGITRSELRIVHKLSSKLKREIILGSSSLDDPSQFIMKLKLL